MRRSTRREAVTSTFTPSSTKWRATSSSRPAKAPQTPKMAMELECPLSDGALPRCPTRSASFAVRPADWVELRAGDAQTYKLAEFICSCAGRTLDPRAGIPDQNTVELMARWVRGGLALFTVGAPDTRVSIGPPLVSEHRVVVFRFALVRNPGPDRLAKRGDVHDESH